jgi:glycosyltransferase involved in cell wall biosynthesis
LIHNKIIHVTGDVHYAILGGWFNLRVLTIHDLTFMHRNKGVKRSILKWFWIVLPVKLAHRVTVISEATKTDVLKFVPSSHRKIKVIPNFISDHFVPIPVHSFNHERPNLLQIGTAFNKNINRLAEAIAGIPCTLTIIGKLDSEQKRILKQFKIQYNNKIDLTEDDLYREYASADLLTFVSTMEGFGLPIIEANACGVPVITSNNSSMPEVAGDAAFFVDPFDIHSIRDGIQSLISDGSLRNEFIEKGFENSKRFSKAKVAEQYELLYQELEKEV